MAKKQLFNLYLGAINMMKRNTPLKLSYNEKIDITEKDYKNMKPNWRCHYTEIVIRTCSFCLCKLGLYYVMWYPCSNFNLEENDAESVKQNSFYRKN